MLVKATKALSLGVAKKDPSVGRNGENVAGWFRLDFAPWGDTAVRCYIDDPKLQADVLRHCSEWGSLFEFDGEIDTGKGRLTLTAVRPCEDGAEVDLFEGGGS